uniref:ATP synthase subunit I n=1 Tax=Desulfacinum infernum TaxID=35837 RepID=A0A832A313_9BACT
MSATIPMDGIRGYYAYQRRLARSGFTGAVTLGLIFYALGYSAIAKGLVLGALFSVLSFVLMAYVLPYQVGVGHKKKTATGVAFVSFVVRLGLMAVPLIIAAKNESFNLWAAIVGLFTVQAAIFVEHFVVKRWAGPDRGKAAEGR